MTIRPAFMPGVSASGRAEAMAGTPRRSRFRATAAMRSGWRRERPSISGSPIRPIRIIRRVSGALRCTEIYAGVARGAVSSRICRCRPTISSPDAGPPTAKSTPASVRRATGRSTAMPACWSRCSAPSIESYRPDFDWSIGVSRALGRVSLHATLERRRCRGMILQQAPPQPKRARARRERRPLANEPVAAVGRTEQRAGGARVPSDCRSPKARAPSATFEKEQPS